MKKLFLILFVSFSGFAQNISKKDYVITMETNMGTMTLLLFDDTPLHKANFVKLAEDGFYDGTLFHRVINEFMIQGGDPTSKNAKPGQQLGSGGDELARIPYEFTTNHIHTKGALAAARTNNPKKESSGCQFYIVTGKKYSEKQLAVMENRTGMKYTPEQTNLYTEVGGTPFLDNNYTVFGTVIQGIEVAEAIEKVKTASDRPLEDVSMKVSVKKMSKKKINKKYNYTYKA